MNDNDARGRFAECLALTLREEGGEAQPVGGPYVRGRFAYSDDPDDSGGKTMLGLLQREYDAWRRRRGLPLQWVRHITDDELTVIYHDQFWLPVCADQLPAGVDLVVWDMGVNCGTGTAAKTLQRALGCTVDGHIGQITLDAANRADPKVLITRFAELREAYHRQCRTFWKHGKGWLARNARIRDAGLAVVSSARVAWSTTIVTEPERYSEAYTHNARADSAEPRPPFGTELGLAGSGGTSLTMAAPNVISKASVYGRITFTSLLVALVSEPLFWAGVSLVFGAVATWIYRRRHNA